MNSSTMDATVDAKWQRWGFLGGVVFVILNVIAIFVPGNPPAVDAPDEKITTYFMDHTGGLKLGAVLFGFSLIFALWWLASLWRVISKLEPGGPRLALIVVTGMVMSGAIAGVAQAMFGAVAVRIDSLGAGGSVLVFTIGNALFGLALAAIAVHLLAMAVLTMRSGFVAQWTGWIALVGALVCAVGVVGAGTNSKAIGVIQMIGFPLWMLWILIVSVLLYMRKPA